MTPKELAEKIRDQGNSLCTRYPSLGPIFTQWCESLISSALEEAKKDNPIRMTDGEKAFYEAQIKQARAEGFMECHKMSIQSGAAANCEKHASLAKEIGKQEAYEHAAKICDDFTACNHGENCPTSECNCTVDISLLIRQAAKEIK